MAAIPDSMLYCMGRVEREQLRAARRAADAGTPRFSNFRAELEEAKERGRHLPPTGRHVVSYANYI